ncbi:MAG: hypothetical protein ABI171_08530 [Collimonas sp.]|uniref:hypothetical protein n=1 Tax=Collimonas sp. TaxID=1963772 RepID=UPI0032646351
MNSPAGSTSRIELGRGSGSMFHASRGTTIVSLQGNMLIAETDSYLTDISVANCALLHEGDCHVIRRSGWVRLHAQGSSNAAGLVIVPTGNFLASFLARWRRRSDTSAYAANQTHVIES